MCVRIAFCCLLIAPGPLLSQTVGRVIAADGRAVRDVLVEVWGRGEVLHRTHTGRQGYFAVSSPDGRRVTRYVFRHLAFEIAIVQHDDLVPGINVELSRLAYALEGLAVTASSNICPQDEEPEARRVWLEASARYNSETSTRGMAGFYQAAVRDLSERELFTGLERDFAANVSLWVRWPSGVRIEQGRTLSLEEMVIERGYAWDRDLRGPYYSLGRDKYLHWRYAELDERSASHFVTPTFGALHTFAVQDDDDGVRVSFCPQAGTGTTSTVRGSFLVDPDGRMIESEWRFETEDPAEGAGGWVLFGTARDPLGGAPHLVPTRSLFYRYIPDGTWSPGKPRWYFRDLREWGEWVVSPDTRIPEDHGAASVPRSPGAP